MINVFTNLLQQTQSSIGIIISTVIIAHEDRIDVFYSFAFYQIILVIAIFLFYLSPYSDDMPLFKEKYVSSSSKDNRQKKIESVKKHSIRS